ncbi:MAG: DUF5615 family PIN-like protein [bacterium]|nr:DUF5615 family PIN-like protein [bacterium]
MITFYTDANIDKQVAIQLRKYGIPVIRCQDVGMDNATDEEHLAYASANQLTLVTKDSDFRALHYQCLSEERIHYGIFLCSNCQVEATGRIIKECITYFQLFESFEDVINKLFEI